MKKLQLILILLFIFNSSIISQSDSLITIFFNANIRVADISKSQLEIDKYIRNKKISLLSYLKTKTKLEFEFNTNAKGYNDLKLKIREWGYLYFHKETTKNYIEKVKNLKIEKAALEKEKQQYTRLSKIVDSSDSRYFEYSENIIQLNKAIDNFEYRIQQLKKKHKVFNIKIEIKEETNTTTYGRSDWVNMPGVEYSYLKTENPDLNYTPQQMTGYSLKYLFHTGKSYAILGLYRANITDSTTVNDMYIFGFGQDFYSRHFGHGENKFLNLYISFNAGVYINSNKSEVVNASWFVNPFFGLELFKTKHILIDSKVGYFMPFETNKTQRGLLTNISFNFVF